MLPIIESLQRLRFNLNVQKAVSVSTRYCFMEYVIYHDIFKTPVERFGSIKYLHLYRLSPKTLNDAAAR